MQIKSNHQSYFWLKVAVICVALALIFSFFSIGLVFLLTTIIGLFVDIVLFVVLDVFLAAILFMVDVLVYVIVDVFVVGIVAAVDIFVFLLLGGLAIAGYALLAAVVIIPLALVYRYVQNQNKYGNADYK